MAIDEARAVVHALFDRHGRRLRVAPTRSSAVGRILRHVVRRA
jgi:hypothetical protein